MKTDGEVFVPNRVERMAEGEERVMLHLRNGGGLVMTDEALVPGNGLSISNRSARIRPVAVDTGRFVAKPAGGELLRVLDILGAAAALLFLMPLMIMTALMVKLGDGGDVFFRQSRIGLGGRRFTCLKFRTMVPDAEARLQALLATSADARAQWQADHKLRHDPRITLSGAFLRKSSLDELPQLFNVLMGDMSLVGPRPITQREIGRYGWRFRSYCSVRPGLTGLWQVSGRNDTTYRRRVALDHYFVRVRGLKVYLWVLFATIPAVFMRRGSY